MYSHPKRRMSRTALGRLKLAVHDVEEGEATVRAAVQLYRIAKSTLQHKILRAREPLRCER